MREAHSALWKALLRWTVLCTLLIFKYLLLSSHKFDFLIFMNFAPYMIFKLLSFNSFYWWIFQIRIIERSKTKESLDPGVAWLLKYTDFNQKQP